MSGKNVNSTAAGRDGRYAIHPGAQEGQLKAALLEQAAIDAPDRECRRAMLEICPECRRKNDIPKIMRLYQEAKA